MNARTIARLFQIIITMDISKIKIGKRVNFVTARNKENVRRGTVSAINQTCKGPFVVITMKDGTTLQTRAALVS